MNQGAEFINCRVRKWISHASIQQVHITQVWGSVSALCTSAVKLIVSNLQQKHQHDLHADALTAAPQKKGGAESQIPSKEKFTRVQ